MLVTCIFAYLYEKNYTRAIADVTVKENSIFQFAGIIFGLLTFLPMYLINASMYYVGNDYQNYVVYFSRISKGEEQNVDIAYKLVNILVNKLGLEFQWVIFIICIPAYAILLLCIKRYTENMWLSYLLFFLYGFFFLLSLNQIRQLVAVAFVCWSYQYITKRSFVKFLISVLLGASFHFSALIVLPLYFLAHKEWKASFYLILSIIGFPINFYFNQILVFLFSVFLPRYLQSDYITRTYRLEVPYLTMVLVTLLIILAYRKQLLNQVINVVFINCCSLAGVLAVFYTWVPEFTRFIYYLFIPAIFLVPQILALEKRRMIRFAILIIQVAVCLLYLIMAYRVWAVFPYRSFFNW